MKGRQKHADRLKILSGQGRLIKAVGRVLYVGADMIRAEAHRSISKGSRSGKKHKPSAENTPPNRDTGVLQAHIRAELVSPLEAQVTSEAPYAAAMEFGADIKNGFGKGLAFKVAARPHMRPARDNKAPEIQRLFETEIDKLVKGSGT